MDADDQQRLSEIKGSWTQNRQEWWEQRAHQDVPWLIYQIMELEHEVSARDHMLDAMGNKYGFHLE